MLPCPFRIHAALPLSRVSGGCGCKEQGKNASEERLQAHGYMGIRESSPHDTEEPTQERQAQEEWLHHSHWYVLHVPTGASSHVMFVFCVSRFDNGAAGNACLCPGILIPFPFMPSTGARKHHSSKDDSRRRWQAGGVMKGLRLVAPLFCFGSMHTCRRRGPLFYLA